MPNNNDDSYTASEDIRDVLQILAAIKVRPCVNRGGANRGTVAAYSELTRMVQRLERALSKVEAFDFPRPMGVPDIRTPRRRRTCPDCGKPNEIRGHMDCQFPSHSE